MVQQSKGTGQNIEIYEQSEDNFKSKVSEPLKVKEIVCVFF